MSDDKKTLLELVSITAEIESQLIESSGELTPEIEAMLAVKDMQLPTKIDGYALLIQRMDTVSDFYKAKADQMLKLSKSATKVIDRLKANLEFAMTELKVDELTGNDLRFKLQDNPASVNFTDKTLIPDNYKIIETVVSLDNKKVLEDLKLGVPVAGAELKQGKHIRTYAAKKIGK